MITNILKGRLSVISNDPPSKDDSSRLQGYPWNLYLINNVEAIAVFLGLKLLNSHYSQCVSVVEMYMSHVDKPQLKIIIFPHYKHLYIIHTRTDKAVKGTFPNRALISLHRKSLKITFTILKMGGKIWSFFLFRKRYRILASMLSVKMCWRLFRKDPIHLRRWVFIYSFIHLFIQVILSSIYLSIPRLSIPCSWTLKGGSTPPRPTPRRRLRHSVQARPGTLFVKLWDNKLTLFPCCN